MEIFGPHVLHSYSLASSLPRTAIELAVKLYATKFLLEPKVQRVIHDVWNGLLLPHEVKDGRVVFKTNKSMASIRNGFFDPNKVLVPK
jgi:hypothetical protein